MSAPQIVPFPNRSEVGAARPRLTLAVITKNERLQIRACLESVAGLADEIVVVDSGSTDGTCDVVREYGARVLETDWPGFGIQKNRAVELARGEWVLSLDADERLSPELRDEIARALDDPGGHVAFTLPRLSKFCGKYLRHGGWWPDRTVKLFRKERGRFTDSLIHERVVPDGPVGALRSPLLHDSFTDLEEVLDKMNGYSSTSARMLRENARGGSLAKAVLRGGWMFLRTYVLKRGFLDGRHGFMLAVANAEGTYYRYLKLMMLDERKAA